MADVFRNEQPAEAVEQHPELAAAYAYVRATEAKAEADGLNEQQRAMVRARVVDNVATRIERGELPRVQMREAVDRKAEQSRDREK